MSEPHKSIAFAMPYYNRGPGCNFFPSVENLREPDALEKYVLHGWLPEKPFITKKHIVTAFGSCFAGYIIDYLNKHHYNISDEGVQPYIVHYGAEIVNTFTVAQQFEWSWEDKEFSEGLWITREKLPLEYNESVRQSTKNWFNKTDVFIITLGLSEIWYNKQTNEVYWRAAVKDKFDPEVHGFRIATYQENVDNLHIIIKLIKKHRPNASIILTLSPVPLIATFRPVSCQHETGTKHLINTPSKTPSINLKWSEKEVTDILKILSGKIFLYDQASEEKFKTLASQANIIHLATHAVIDDETPLYSKFLFSHPNKTADDGLLHTYEIYNTDLNANLAVLSACNTGTGKLVNGEGIMSLARSFMYAGCPNVVVSLWQIDDKSTASIMNNFYKEIKRGADKDAALRNAKLEYLKNADEVKSNPFYWAGFVLIGNSDPVPFNQKSIAGNYKSVIIN